MGCQKNVETTFTYLEWNDRYQHEKPLENLLVAASDEKHQGKTNIRFHEGPVEQVIDVRKDVAAFTLDEHGFTYCNQETQLTLDQFKNAAMIEHLYLPECEELLRTFVDDVDEVYLYNWRLRSSESPNRQGATVNVSDPTYPFTAAPRVHVDLAKETAEERVGAFFPTKKDFLLRGRVRHINIWRPINGPVQTYPLAVCDGRSLPESNLIETSFIRRKHSGNPLFALYGPGYEWFYMSEQGVSEPLLFKSYDSDELVSGYAAHAAFQLPDGPNQKSPRESIEVRAFVFTYPREEVNG